MTKRRTLSQEMEVIHEQVERFKDVEVTKQNGVENTKILADLQEHLEGLVRDQEEIESREKILGFIITQFPRLESIGNNLRPYQRLWLLHKDSKSRLEYWKTSCIFELNSELVVKERKNMLREATELKHIFGRSKPKPVNVL